MKTNMFNEPIVDNIKDDLSVILQDKADFYAEIYEEDGTFYFEIRSNEDGENIVSSVDLWESKQDVKEWLSSFSVEVVG